MIKTKTQLNQSQQLNLTDEDDGVYIVRVMPNSPAQRAGLRSGDIIEAIDGIEVNESSQVQRQVALREVGTEVTVNVIRGNQTIDIPVRLGGFTQ